MINSIYGTVGIFAGEWWLRAFIPAYIVLFRGQFLLPMFFSSSVMMVLWVGKEKISILLATIITILTKMTDVTQQWIYLSDTQQMRPEMFSVQSETTEVHCDFIVLQQSKTEEYAWFDFVYHAGYHVFVYLL